MSKPYKRRAWTDEEDDQLAAWWADRSISSGEIARRLNRTRRSVRGRVTTLALPPRGTWTRWTDEDDERVAELYRDGLPVAQIADQLGRSRSSVAQRLSGLGISGRRQDWTVPELEQALDLKRDGVKVEQIAEQLGRSTDEVVRKTAPVRSRRYWREWEEALLVRRIDELGVSGVALALSRTVGAVEERRRLLKGRVAEPPEAPSERPDEHWLPASRSGCAGGARPCPLVSCKHHLYLDVNPRTGSIKLNFPDLEVWELPETCALDVADRGAHTLAHVGSLLGLTRERIRQIEAGAIERARDAAAQETATPPEGCSPHVGGVAQPKSGRGQAGNRAVDDHASQT